ncbi:tRNA isopentenyl-2-thiomethyl-A-37 hydroxylase MiaE [Mucisphaera calidilacus]|uniref:tRNA isopentenyl-2-thiomethyl-A-37 hydroxylase MiaE n=1 Tax=Mucisphaera calidilacus TaxID=2527982 RepID=UPI0011A096AE|nr:tRNA isopentenyl-2-thiomethyl-A-37 hydroxylase MiaE [Mucisphaera calidilacus]
MTEVREIEMPLLCRTPASWAAGVLCDPVKLLNDHAHLEKKAGLNALEMLNQWPEPVPPGAWVQSMTAVAREEIEHLQTVLRLLHARGGVFSKGHRNPYAQSLRGQIRSNAQGRLESLMDRLMVSALIELRSCERFAVLGEMSEDAELAGLYRDLWASEHGHYRTFLNLARRLPAGRAQRKGDMAAMVEERWAAMLAAESAILAEQPFYVGMHSGVCDG